MRETHYTFDDETVIVTGGSSGIGRAIALAFAAAGATVINADIREEPKDLDETVPTHDRIQETGGTSQYVRTDVSNPSAIRSLMDRADEHGGVDVMVNNAGINIQSSFHELTEAEFDLIYNVNVKGVFFGCIEASKSMIERGDTGVIINTASISSNQSEYDLIHYESTKGAVRMITRGSALTLARHGIRVNAIAPGQISTEITEGRMEAIADGREEFIKPIPLDRVGYPEDVPGAVLFLASDAAAYITGETIHVDGGWQIV